MSASVPITHHDGLKLGPSAHGLRFILRDNDEIVQIKSHIQAARDRQKSYADVRRKPLEFQVGDKVMLKVSPWKGVIRFGKRGKLNPRYIGPFKILAKVGTVVLSPRTSSEMRSKGTKNWISSKIPVEVMDCEVKRLKQSRIPIVKVRWNSRRGPEFTWEREDQMQKKYPHFFTNSTPAAEAPSGGVTCWFKTYESLNDGSILHMGNESNCFVHGRCCVDLRFSSGKVVSLLNVLHVPNIRKNLVSSSVLNNCGYKQVIESNKFVLSKHAFMSTYKLNDSILWHARLGHAHFKRIDLHATPSLGNKKYFVIFIDDASRFCYVYLLHSKDEALDKFKVFKTEVELQQGPLIKRFRTDRGGEYMDTLYIQFVGIIHETTVPYTPQQNSISERKNRVLKEMVNSMLSYSGLSQGFWGESMAVVRLPDPKLKTLGERDIECIFVGYAEHSKASRFYVIEPNDSVAINSIIESRDAIFDEHKLSSVPRPSQRSLPELRKSKRHRTPKDFGPEFQVYLIEGTMDEVSDQHSYCFNVADDPKTFDEAMKSQDTFGLQMDLQKKAEVARISTIRLLIAMASIHNLIIHQIDVKTTFLNGELEEEAPKQWHQKFDEVVLSNGYLLNQADKCVYSKFDTSGKGVIICLYVDDMLIFGTDHVQVDLTKEFLSSRFSMKDMGEADVILGLAVSQLEYSRVIGCLMYAMTCTRPDIAFVVGKLSRYTSNLGTQQWQAIQRILEYLKKTMDYRLMYSGYPSVLEGYTDKQTCITGSTMESEFVNLAAAGKEAEWLKNLLLEILLWVKPMEPISIQCVRVTMLELDSHGFQMQHDSDAPCAVFVRLQAAELVREVFLETFSSYEVHTYGLLGYSIPKQEEMYIPFWKCSGRSRAEPAKYGTSRATLRSDMDYACGISDADCGASISPQIV
ncbi:zinc finger, CCHC-type containing protein [Tanacetum coccineum]